MKRAKLKLAGLLLLVSAAGVVNAQSNVINVVTSAVPFLRISPDARSGGMGDIGVATNPDASSGFWNLAKTPFNTTDAGVCLTYTPWLKDLGLNDVNLITLGGFKKLDELQAVTASLRYFNLGNIQFTDYSGTELGSFRPREFSIDAGYSRKLSDKAGIGIALRFINSKLASGDYNGTTYKPGNSVAGDLSFFHTGQKENGAGLNYGITLTNLGTKISYTNDASQKDYIPANLGLGVAYTKVVDEANKITFGLDVHKLMVPTPPIATNDDAVDQANLTKYRNEGVVSSWFKSFGDAPGGFGEELKEFQISAGAEYMYNNQFAFRTGYFYENPTKGNRKYFTLGAGLKYNNFGLNFSYLLPSGSGTNRNPLSNTLRFSLVFDFDGGTAAAATTAK